MNAESATAPSHWASFLINGTTNSLDAVEKEQALRFVEWLGGWPVSCEYVGFERNHAGVQFGALSSDCCSYTTLTSERLI